MSPFASRLVVGDTPTPDKWELVESLAYGSVFLNGQVFTVPAGFVTDFASVPRVFWSLIPPTGRYSRAAVIHDWLYDDRPIVRLSGARHVITRREADLVFRHAMRELGVAAWRCWAIYLAVRAAGWIVWRRRIAGG